MIRKDKHPFQRQHGDAGRLPSSSGAAPSRRPRLRWPSAASIVAAVAVVIATVSFSAAFWPGSRFAPNLRSHQVAQQNLKDRATGGNAVPSPEPSAPYADTPSPNAIPPGTPGAQDLQTWKKTECAALQEEMLRIEASVRAAPPSQQTDLLVKLNRTHDQLLRLQC